jgi:pimeloyl-ACP methyl ester carboxylesterase
MAPSVEGAGVALNVVERGAGTPVLLIHGLASDAEALAPVAQALADEARVIAYDRRGYGSSGAPEPYRGTTIEEQAQDAAALLGALSPGPAVVCGDGFGALVALDLAKRHRALVRAAVLCNPPLFMFVPEATERLAAQHSELEAAVREGGPQAGVEAWLGGRVEGPALDRARAAYQAFFADYAGLASWPVTRRDLRALDVPAVVLTGPWSPPHIVAAADALAGLLPAARRADDGDLVAAARTLLASP